MLLPLKRSILTKCLTFYETINANKAIAEQYNFIYKFIYLSMTLPWSILTLNNLQKRNSLVIQTINDQTYSTTF